MRWEPILLQIVNYLGMVAITLMVGMLVYHLVSRHRHEAKRLGLRGLKRKMALAQQGTFALVEPLMRTVARLTAYLALPQLRERIDVLLRHSGFYLGLSVNEYLALALLGASAAGGVGLLLVRIIGLPMVLVVFFAGLGAFLPYARVRSEIQRRSKEINRSLPSAIDLMSLAMGAGLDFTGAVRQLIERFSGRTDALQEEFYWMLQEIQLGFTRRQALENFADRAPSLAVREFVSAVVQSEERGTPLVEVLQIQATTARNRRSVRAEELAARAGVMMMGPLALIFVSILLLLMGPFVVGQNF
ncbi:MAG: type II secretion system F family protein [Myxococcales bacterium]|nr:type II secretion system F family protein [Myxococcales bacterium]